MPSRGAAVGACRPTSSKRCAKRPMAATSGASLPCNVSVLSMEGPPKRRGEFFFANLTPARHDELALTVGGEAHDWRKLVGKDCGQRRQIARAIVLHAEEIRIADWPLVTR